MKTTITITYEWFNDNQEIPEDHKNRLRDHAEDHIKEMMEKGYETGELLFDTPEESYRGWWDINQTHEE